MNTNVEVSRRAIRKLFFRRIGKAVENLNEREDIIRRRVVESIRLVARSPSSCLRFSIVQDATSDR